MYIYIHIYILKLYQSLPCLTAYLCPDLPFRIHIEVLSPKHSPTHSRIDVTSVVDTQVPSGVHSNFLQNFQVAEMFKSNNASFEKQRFPTFSRCILVQNWNAVFQAE